MKRLNIRCPQAPTPSGPYGQAVSVEAQRLTWFSAQLPVTQEDQSVSKTLDISAQAKMVIEHLHALLESAGLDFDNIVDVHVYLVSLDDLDAVDEAFKRYLGPREPARTVVQVPSLPGGALVQIDAVAAS